MLTLRGDQTESILFSLPPLTPTLHPPITHDLHVHTCTCFPPVVTTADSINCPKTRNRFLIKDN